MPTRISPGRCRSGRARGTRAGGAPAHRPRTRAPPRALSRECPYARCRRNPGGPASRRSGRQRDRPRARAPAAARTDWPARSRSRARGGGSIQQLAQHVVEDPAVAVVLPLIGRVDPDGRLEGRVARGDLELLRALLERRERELLVALQPERLDRLPARELE